MLQLGPEDHALLIDIVAYGEPAMQTVMHVAQFTTDEKTFDSVIRCIGVVGEATWKLSKGAACLS